MGADSFEAVGAVDYWVGELVVRLGGGVYLGI